MILGDYIACMCEGNAEKAIIDILLDNDLLLFNRESMIEEESLSRCSVSDFEKKYLRKSYNGKISLLRIIDSKSEQFNLHKEYRDKVDVINIITAPEIEILMVIAENKYDDYIKYRNKKKNNNRPSDYCKEVLNMPDVKKYDYIREYYQDFSRLVNAISKYKKYSKIKKDEYTLYDMLKMD